ncbi:hypothetical protein [Micromonospora sp. NPDC050495]|uniref:hypothetical protein n=1 Tax=Micromonospora sp. NPDC050495 TaxID=3154936 RepID=UPI0033F6FAF7
MSGYYLAPALAVLRAEIDTRWPRRDHTSDGWIGDARHQATPSDHNPNGRGSVNALDVDVDGIDPYVVLAAVERHPSAHYWIYRRQIADRDDGWRRRPYDGPSPHTEHLHVSIRQTRTAEQDRRPWGLLEDDMITDADARKIAAAVHEQKLGRSDVTIGVALQQTHSRVGALAEAAGVDQVDEQAIVSGVLAGLAGVDIDDAVTALKAAFGDRAAELGARLAS